MKQSTLIDVRPSAQPVTLTLTEWQARYSRMREIAERIAASRHRRAFALARQHGMTCGCCIHNASISEVGKGWGAGPNGREVIRTAKAATRILSTQFDGNRILDRWAKRVRIV
jgi:hypothetical protein